MLNGGPLEPLSKLEEIAGCSTFYLPVLCCYDFFFPEIEKQIKCKYKNKLRVMVEQMAKFYIHKHVAILLLYRHADILNNLYSQTNLRSSYYFS